MVKIVLDALGGDNSPSVNVLGAIKAVNAINDLEILLVGYEDKLKQELAGKKYDEQRIKIINCTDEISCNDIPTQAIRLKKDSSLVVSLDLLRNNEDLNAIVSIGSTGAVLTGAVLKLGRLTGVKRPALCPILPTMNGGLVSICDAGANTDCDSAQLVQFAVMASLYMEKVFNVKSPKVALLNIGAEEEKGDLLRKETYQLLKNSNAINFIGNIEGRELLTGYADVVVADGFSGNILLKTAEGACKQVMKLLKSAMTKNLKTKMGALMLKKEVYKLKDTMDYNNYGGAVLLGTAKTVVKGHGSGNVTAVYKCIEQAYNMEKNNLREKIAEGISSLSTL